MKRRESSNSSQDNAGLGDFANKTQYNDALLKECRPSLYRMADPIQAKQLRELVQNNPQIAIFDCFKSQIAELIETRHPGEKLSAQRRDDLVLEYQGGDTADKCGVWVHYPWSNRLVHLLAEQDFAELRTSRNVYKITVDEQRVLAGRKIGIIGLSVGQSVALTLAMERGFGELRIADFDSIELSNLNRIRAGVHDLGVPKVVVVAREIAEIDPYLKVRCFGDGVTEENLQEFLLGSGQLDLLIDECDDLDMKIRARQRAREWKIPVLMETSDRGMIDVERFDLEPDRPIFHGLVEHLHTSNLKGLSREEKVPFVLSIVGIETMSDRMKASFLEIEQTISTWPQLASDVVLGGATTACISRQIALGQFRSSGRFFVDLDTILSDAPLTHCDSDVVDDSLPVSVAEVAPRIDANLAVFEQQVELDCATVAQLVETATMAPSGGNCQPWKWHYKDRNLYLYVDPARSSSYLDFERMGSYLSLGAAAENLVLAAHQMGLEIGFELFPASSVSDLVAVFRFYQSQLGPAHLESHDHDSLFPAIPLRVTNRNIATRSALPTTKLTQIVTAAESVAGSRLQLITDHRQLNAIGEVVASCDRLLLTDKKGHQGFMDEIRWTSQEAQQTRDGIELATIELTAADIAGFKMARRWQVVENLAKWGGGSAFEQLSRQGVAAASAVGLLTMPDFSAANYFNAGRAVQRMWLCANQNDVCLQPMSAGVFLFARMLHGGSESMNSAMHEELLELRQVFGRNFHRVAEQQEIFLFRLFQAGPPPGRSLRRPVDEILVCS